jgi:hypothetical protein
MFTQLHEAVHCMENIGQTLQEHHTAQGDELSRDQHNQNHKNIKAAAITQETLNAMVQINKKLLAHLHKFKLPETAPTPEEIPIALSA